MNYSLYRLSLKVGCFPRRPTNTRTLRQELHSKTRELIKFPLKFIEECAFASNSPSVKGGQESGTSSFFHVLTLDGCRGLQ